MTKLTSYSSSTARILLQDSYDIEDIRSRVFSVKTRKNGANGNLPISVSANSTGLFQDISDSDSVLKFQTILYFLGIS